MSLPLISEGPILKILVLGKHGQVAKSLKESAENSDHDVQFASHEEIDLLSIEKLEHSLKEISYDILINTAAYTAVDKAESEKDKAFQINALAVGKLAQVSHQKSAKVIHISTDYVYGDMGDKLLTEESLTSPINHYGFSKLAGENFLKESGVSHLILRTSWVYSPWGVNFVKTMLKLGLNHEEIKVVSDQIGSPTYSVHLAQAIFQIIEKWYSPKQDGVYNLTGAETCSWYEFAQGIFSFAEEQNYPLKLKKLMPILSRDYPVAAKRPLNSRLSQKKIIETFNIQMPTWKEGLKECLMKTKLDSI